MRNYPRREQRYARAAAEAVRLFIMLRVGLHLGLRRQLLVYRADISRPSSDVDARVPSLPTDIVPR